MATMGQKRGCVHASTGRPKTGYPSREEAQAGLEWMVRTQGTDPAKVRVYECRYSPDPLAPHFHVGGKPLADRRNHGRMPVSGGNHRR